MPLADDDPNLMNFCVLYIDIDQNERKNLKNGRFHFVYL